MQTFWLDLRYGARMLLKQKGFTAIAALSLALGIGANTALFSVVDAMLLKMLPVREPERLVLFRTAAPPGFSPGSYSGGNSYTDPATGQLILRVFPYQIYQHMRKQQGALSDVFVFSDLELYAGADGRTEAASGQVVSGNYFAGLGVPALLGRTLTDEDDKASASPVAVLSYRYWRRRFGGDKSVIGKQINLNNVAFTIIGVTSPGFEGVMNVGTTQDVTVPVVWEPLLIRERIRSRMSGAGEWWLRMMGRLKPGATAEQARAQLENVFHQAVVEHRAARQAQALASGGNAIGNLDPIDYPRLFLDPGGQGEMYTRQYYAPSLYLLQGVVGLVLLIACANVANLLLARAAARQKEVALRSALGASRWRLIRQLLTESVLLAVLGGALGTVFAFWIKNGLLAVSDWGGRGMRALEPQLDWRALAFTLGLSLLTGVTLDAKYTRQRDEVPPTAYLSWRQELRWAGMGETYEVRIAGDPTAFIAAVRQAIREVDANLPLNNIKTQVEQARETLRMERLFAKLLTLFGLLAQSLAAVGLFGVMAYSVAGRTREIGIRMALGADRRDVMRLILRQGMALALLGVALGAACAYAMTKYLESRINLKDMLYGVRVNDPLTYSVIAVSLMLVALAACLIPARRATRVDPMTALRCE